ncbi:MAG: thioredoxin peroxidase [Parcubacteria group bacterium]|nr:thioredoxin peroxidase [Parcubacteria group bacterium]
MQKDSLDEFELQVGHSAPAWSATAYQKGKEFRTVSSADYAGKWVVLFFYPRNFTFVCPTELKAFAASCEEFREVNAQLVAVSTDSEWSHKAWFEKDMPDVQYPVLADTTHEIAWNYNVLVEKTGEALRGTFIIDPEGVLRYSVVSDLNVGRSVDETLRVLRALQTGGLCPANWKQGEATLQPGAVEQSQPEKEPAFNVKPTF